MYKDGTHEQKKALTREFKSKMLNRIVETISQTEIRDMVGFRGGAVLHLAYSSPRYTNDLDFIWLQSDSFENKSKIISILSENKLFVENMPMKFNVKKFDANTLRLSYCIETGDENFRPNFIIESTDKSNEVYDLVKRNTPHGYILVEKPEDILIDKIIATVNRYKTRQSIKDTDVFDICFLMNKKRFLTSQTIVQKAEYYNINYNEILNLLTESSEYIKYNKNKIWNNICEQLDSTYILNIDRDIIFGTTLNILKYTREIMLKESQMKLF